MTDPDITLPLKEPFPSPVEIIVRHNGEEKIYGKAHYHGPGGYHVPEKVEEQIRQDFPSIPFKTKLRTDGEGNVNGLIYDTNILD